MLVWEVNIWCLSILYNLDGCGWGYTLNPVLLMEVYNDGAQEPIVGTWA